jgi:hypothetical protein
VLDCPHTISAIKIGESHRLCFAFIAAAAFKWEQDCASFLEARKGMKSGREKPSCCDSGESRLLAWMRPTLGTPSFLLTPMHHEANLTTSPVINAKETLQFLPIGAIRTTKLALFDVKRSAGQRSCQETTRITDAPPG